MLRRIVLYALPLCFAAVFAAQPNVNSLGPQVGEVMPAFSGVDQFGRTQTLESVLGPEGAMIVFFRSADW